MVDGKWYTQTMEEGVNQGCPFLSILAAFVSHQVLRPLTKKLLKRACARQKKRRFGDDKLGGKTNPMTYIDNCGACVPHEDVLFFLKEFGKLAGTHGCHLNREKTRVMTSTLGTFSLPDIEQTYGKKY